MVQFQYRAVGRDGRTREGVIEAERQETAARQLRAQGLTPLRLADVGASREKRGKPANRDDVRALTHELAVLLRSGLPLDRSLRVLAEMAPKPSLRLLLDDILKAVKGGRTLSSALEHHGQLFGNFYISMVRAGEASGQMAEVLERLAAYLQEARTTRDSVVSALIYPAILLVVAVLSIILMLGFVVPQFESLFADMGEALPALTRLVLAAADFIAAWGWLLALVTIAGVFLFRRWAGTADGRLALDRRALRMPLAGPLVFEFEMARFARTAGTLLANGVGVLRAISIATDTVANRALTDALETLPPAIKAGRQLSVALDETSLFTPMVIQMVRVGEESGRLDALFLELARVFDEHVQAGVKRSLTLLEPVLILFMGFVIAVIIIAILMGILSVNDLAL